MFIEWWNNLGTVSQIFYCIAVPATLVLLIQTVMMLLGMDDSGEAGDVGDIGDSSDSIFGDADAALKLLIADKLEDLMKVQVDAIKNIKIDKVTVWDGGQNADGKTSTANFISGMMKSVPPLDEVFTMAGMQLPSLLGKKLEEGENKPAEENEE